MKNFIKYMITAMAAMAAIVPCAAQDADDDGLTIMLTGASFAVRENGWFELGCAQLGATPINKAVSGEAIYHTANRMAANTFYTFEELENTDILVIDHVHNQNVADETVLEDDYNDYSMPTQNYAVAYDYVIRRYKDDCYNLKDNPESKYYGTESGKPAVIVLCTHWHDSRTKFNPAIRELAEKWDLPLVKFDEKIGFTKDVLVDGRQPSLQYCADREWIDGVEYGWHPKRGQGEYIQQKMAQIFVDEMSRVLGVEVPFTASLSAKDIVVFDGETPWCKVEAAGGMYPYTLSYSVGGERQEDVEININPFFFELPAAAVGNEVSVVSLTDSEGREAVADGNFSVALAQRRESPVYDAFAHENFKKQSHAADELLELKSGQGWGRQIYLTFATAVFTGKDERAVLRLYLKEMDKNVMENLLLEGNTETYDETLCWNNKDEYHFEQISSDRTVAQAEVGTYLSFDVTDWLKAKKAEGAENVTFRISVTSDGYSLCRFYATESYEHPELAPELAIVGEPDGGVDVAEVSDFEVYPHCFSGELHIVGDCMIYSVDGKLMFKGGDATVNTSEWNRGLYIAKGKHNTVKVVKR